jgi:hypothetical protein
MPRPAGQPSGKIGGLGGVVEDHQPPVPLPEFGQHHRPDHLDPCTGLYAA